MSSRSIPIFISLAAAAAAGGCSSSPPPESEQSVSAADTGSALGGFLSFGGQYGYDKCLDIQGDVIAESVNLDSGNCNDTQAQRFIIDGTQIHPAQNTSYCLDLQNANYVPGVWIQLWPCNGLPNQQWTFQNGSIHSQGAAQAGKNLCLDVLNNDSTGGAPVGMGTCNDTLEQLWFPFGFTVQLQSTEMSGNSHECLDVWQDETTTVGQQVDDYTCDVNSDRDDAQEFTFTEHGTITNHNLCLGWVAGGYNPLQMQTCTGAVQQIWQFAPGPNGTLNIQNVGGFDKCMDVPGNNATPGTVADMTYCNGSSEQQWSPVLTGTPCGAAGQYCCVNPAQSQCSPGNICDQNVCVACPAGTVSFDGKCVVPGTLGNPCNPGGYDNAGSCAEGSTCDPKTNTCHSAGQAGQWCYNGGSCNPGNLYCDSYGWCEPTGGSGAPCNGNNTCNAGALACIASSPTQKTCEECGTKGHFCCAGENGSSANASNAACLSGLTCQGAFCQASGGGGSSSGGGSGGSGSGSGGGTSCGEEGESTCYGGTCDESNGPLCQSNNICVSPDCSECDIVDDECCQVFCDGSGDADDVVKRLPADGHAPVVQPQPVR